MEPFVEHLENVYSCLVISILTAIVATFSIGIFITKVLWVAIISSGGSSLIFMILLILPDVPDKNRILRFCLLQGFAGFSGIGLTNIFKGVLEENPILLITAFLETCLIFCSLSTCAIFSENGRWLFLGIPLTVLIFTLIVVSYANVVEESRTVSRAILYLSLFAMCGLVLYDTQVIVDSFKNNDKDFIGQTMNVFTDFIGIYRRLLILGVDNLLQQRNRSDSINEDDGFFYGFLSAESSPALHALL